jgi:hypothetical protein
MFKFKVLKKLQKNNRQKGILKKNSGFTEPKYSSLRTKSSFFYLTGQFSLIV